MCIMLLNHVNKVISNKYSNNEKNYFPHDVKLKEDYSNKQTMFLRNWLDYIFEN